MVLFMFICSLRKTDFDLFVSTLKEIAPWMWMFTLDHKHFSRWLPIFLDLKSTEKYQDIAQNFKKGFFTVQKSKRNFSSMGLDQAHEENNKLVKIDDGNIGILENDHAMLKWVVAGLIISGILNQSEEINDYSDHENTKQFEKKFKKDRNKRFSRNRQSFLRK